LPWEGTELTRTQEEVEEMCRKEEEEQEKADLKKIEAERRLGRVEEAWDAPATGQQSVEVEPQVVEEEDDENDGFADEDQVEEEGRVKREESTDDKDL